MSPEGQKVNSQEMRKVWRVALVKVDEHTGICQVNLRPLNLSEIKSNKINVRKDRINLLQAFCHVFRLKSTAFILN